MKYRDRNRKRINLPSGASVTIRKLVAHDFMQSGKLPLVDLGDAKPSGRNGMPTSREQRELEIKLTSAVSRRALVHCTSDFEFDGERAVIVDKPFQECSPTEIAIEDLDQADAQKIMDEVMEFSGFGKEGAAAAAPFRQEQAPDGSASPSGQGIRRLADEPPAPEPAGTHPEPPR